GLLLIGVLTLARRNRSLLMGVLSWFVPYAALAVLFKTEVQHDCWMVGARFPLFLAIGLGAFELGGWAGIRRVAVLRTVSAVATIWAMMANYPDLAQRDYLPAALYGRVILESADPDAIVILSGDDSNGLVS